MLALYRSGRQAEALDVYRDARRSLVEELGIDPSPALQELEQAILRQELPPAPERPPRRRPAASRRAGGRGRSSRWAPQSWPPPSPSPSSASPAGTEARRASGGREWRRSIQRGAVASFTQAGRTPSNVAVGEDASGSARRRRPDDHADRSGERRHREDFSTGTTPKDIAVGAGRSGSATSTRATPEASRGSIPRPPALPGRSSCPARRPASPWSTALARGQPACRRGRLPLGDQPRRDGLPLRRRDRRAADDGPVEATSFADRRWEGGVWVVGEGPGVTRIDPKTNQRGETIRCLPPASPGSPREPARCGRGAPEEGVVWRIEPGGPVARTIEVSVGRGSSRSPSAKAPSGPPTTPTGRSPASTRRRTRSPGCGCPAISRGSPPARGRPGSASWGTTAGPLSTAACGPLESGGQSPDLLIVSDVPLQGEQAQYAPDRGRDPLRAPAARVPAGSYAVGYHSCDDATAQAESWSDVKCMANARAYAAAEQLVAVIGPYNSSALSGNFRSRTGRPAAPCR